MSDRASSLLKRLEKLKLSYGGDAAARKLELLRPLARARLGSADEVSLFHELLCFVRAYPDDAAVQDQVETMLQAFADRGDLRRFSRSLDDSGVAGTRIHFSFFWSTARWLARHWPDSIEIDWREFEKRSRLGEILHLLMPYSETPSLDMLDYSPREWIDRLKSPDETDAAFLIRRFETLKADSFGRESTYESLDVPMRISPGADTPSRTRARVPTASVVHQTQPLSRKRPKLKREIQRPPVGVRALTPREGQRVIDVTRAAMVTRHRDLDVFAYADRNDVRLVDCGDGLQFACLGAIPERRLMFEAVYGFLTIKNGVPIGYVLSSSLFGSSEIAYNVFDTFRGAEAATVFGRVLGMAHYLFGSDTFAIDPYQLGHGNREGLESGAWWFYYKLGFRPIDRRVKQRVRQELERMKRDPRYRSGIDTLDDLSSEYMFWQPGRSRADVMGRVDVGQIGLKISDYLAERYGSDRERGIRECEEQARRVLGVRSLAGFPSGERQAWRRFSPLIAILPGLGRWSTTSKRDLARIVRAKGGRRESDYVRLSLKHRPLWNALLKLAK